jgi:transposase
LRLLWTEHVLSDLANAAGWSRVQAEAVVNAMTWMAETGFSLGRRIRQSGERYWPVPPLGVVYRVQGDTMIVLEVIDARRRVEPW